MQKNQTSVAKNVACSHEKLSGGDIPPPVQARLNNVRSVTGINAKLSMPLLHQFYVTTQSFGKFYGELLELYRCK